MLNQLLSSGDMVAGGQVNVARAAEPSAATKGLIEKIEDKRSSEEAAMFEQAGDSIDRRTYMRSSLAIITLGLRGNARAH